MKGGAQAVALYLSKSKPAVLPVPGIGPFSQIKPPLETSSDQFCPSTARRSEATLGLASFQRGHAAFLAAFLSAMWTPVKSGQSDIFAISSQVNLIFAISFDPERRLCHLLIHMRTLRPREGKCMYFTRGHMLVSGLKVRLEPTPAFATHSQAWALPIGPHCFCI